MAKNRKYTQGSPIKLPVPAGTVSGNAVCVGAQPIAGVALTDRDGEGNAVCDCGGVYKFKVEGKNKAGNSKVSVGDIIYLKEGKLNKNNEEGARFGVALEEVTSGGETEIAVRVGY